MKRLVGLIMIILGSAMAFDQILGRLALASAPTAVIERSFPVGTLVWCFLMVLAGVKLRQKKETGL